MNLFATTKNALLRMAKAVWRFFTAQHDYNDPRCGILCSGQCRQPKGDDHE